MGILKGALSGRRYTVQGTVPDDFRTRYVEALNANAFREPLSPLHQEEVHGWCQHGNLLDTTFDDLNQWLYNSYAHLGLRFDKKTLPDKLFQAHLKKRIADWCAEKSRERCPSAVKQELKQLLTTEMLQQTLPTVNTTEIVWNTQEGWVFLASTSETVSDTFRKLFYRTFGLVAVPFSPGEVLSSELLNILNASGAPDLRASPAGDA